jgi:ribose/xylose/arabinose/galactoside ABC-type transport system permease subunit
VGLGTGVFNALIVRVLKLPSIIATLGTFSILEGASLLLRDHPEGPISSDAINGLTTSVGFLPIAFVAVVVIAVLADVWLYRTRAGLAARAVGLDETSSRRLGMATGRIVILAFVSCSVMASLAGFFLAAQVQIAALFLSLIDNVLPLFHQPTEYSQITIGVLILLALVLYQSPELLGRLRTSRAGVGRLQAGEGEAPAG